MVHFIRMDDEQLQSWLRENACNEKYRKMKPMAKSGDKPKVDTKTEDVSLPWLCACEERGYMSWFCYYFFCSGFAMNTLAKRMSEGRKIVYIIVFLLFLTVGLIKFTLRGLIIYNVQSVNTVKYTEYGPWPAETYDTNDKVAPDNLDQGSSPHSDLVYDLLGYIEVIGALSSILTIIMLIMTCDQRRRFVLKHKHSEGQCESCLVVLCCTPCAYGQMGSTYTV